MKLKATLLPFPVVPGGVPCPILQQVLVRQLGEHSHVIVSFPVQGILELTKEKTEERTDNSRR